MTEEKAAGRIVVGVDGSAASAAALRWARAEADARGAELHAVTAWLYDPILDEASIARTQAEAREAHLAKLKEFVATALGDDPGVEVTYEAPDGDAADMLVARSVDAAMLVLGGHGTRKLRHLLVGSVCAACLRHACCPVVVLPEEVTSKVDVLERLLGSAASYVPGPVL
ncbi:universal stress protein [Amycolatopsis sp. NPDC059021]|uniref:universal stress protein n=1 Tax=Amycolatopsis sp. NPDC059021 TaxID=3346704 RepID=UPI00366A58CA